MKLRLSLLLIIFISLLSFGFLKSDEDIYFRIAKSIDIFGKVYKEISLNYVDEINPEEFMRSGIRGMLSSLDPYTVYVDENMRQDIEVITKGKYGGIGATIGLRNDMITVVDLLEGHSAQRQGIQIGDVIIRIDSVSVGKENYEDLSTFIKGVPGTMVNIVILREGFDGEMFFSLIREEIEVKNISYYGFVPEESDNAYIKMSGFSFATGEELKKALLDLKSQKPIGTIILDLRGNPGGLLSAAIDVTEKFIGKDKLIVSVVSRDSTEVTRYLAEEAPIADKSRLAVLIDGGTASASEIVAGAIQDHDRGLVIGTNSFGKGLVQTVVNLNNRTSLKLTTARYFTPSGRCIQKIDYATDNKIFDRVNVPETRRFYTDNKRSVWSAGGIVPDSIVKNSSESDIIPDLIAKGYFFKFSSFYFNTNNIEDISKIDKNKIIDDFSGYLQSSNYEYTGREVKLFAEMKKLYVEDGLPEEFRRKFDALYDSYRTFKKERLLRNKEEIINEIMKELSGRLKGREGRIIQSLKLDDQFETAYNLLQNQSLYNNMLKVN